MSVCGGTASRGCGARSGGGSPKTGTWRSPRDCGVRGCGCGSGPACWMWRCPRLAGNGTRGRGWGGHWARAAGGGGGGCARGPRRALGARGSYLDPVAGARAEVVARARDAGRYDRLAGMRVVTGYDPRRRVLFVDGPSGPAPVPVDVLGPDERRLLFRRAPGGLEPLAVWLSVNGLPKKPHGWEDTFADANTRIARAWAFAAGHGAGGVPAAEECPLWCRPHMCRHSFALKWFSILSV